jgi:DNA-binding CsgD family transcriptional regulator
LTPREIEVLRLIAAGRTAKEAARQLDIAPKTADNHIQSLYSKIGVTTRVAAALYALDEAWFSTEYPRHRESTPCDGGWLPPFSPHEPRDSAAPACARATKRDLNSRARSMRLCRIQGGDSEESTLRKWQRAVNWVIAAGNENRDGLHQNYSSRRSHDSSLW